MKMASMKLPKMSEKDKEEKMTVGPGYQDEYPYGLRITLNEDQVKALEGVFDHDVEAAVVIHAKGKVCDKRSSERSGKKPVRTMEIQITDLSVMGHSAEADSDGNWYQKKKGAKE